MFQPGVHGVPFQQFQLPQPQFVYIDVPAAAEDAGGEQTEWERAFAPPPAGPTRVLVAIPQPFQVPHLQFVYCHWSGRFHMTPYEPGYASSPWEFPESTSPLHIWKSSRGGGPPRPQVPHMCYHDPAPVVLPAEIRLRGSGLMTLKTQAQPIPMPLPRPASAELITPPARTMIGERVRQNWAPFIVR